MLPLISAQGGDSSTADRQSVIFTGSFIHTLLNRWFQESHTIRALTGGTRQRNSTDVFKTCRTQFLHIVLRRDPSRNLTCSFLVRASIECQEEQLSRFFCDPTDRKTGRQISLKTAETSLRACTAESAWLTVCVGLYNPAAQSLNVLTAPQKYYLSLICHIGTRETLPIVIILNS